MKEDPRPYIVKPNAKGEGHGIFVVDTVEELDARVVDGYIAQPLLTNPYLIQGKKFDFRYDLTYTYNCSGVLICQLMFIAKCTLQ